MEPTSRAVSGIGDGPLNIRAYCLASIFREVYVAHVAAGEEFLMERESGVEVVGRLTAKAKLKVVAEKLLVHRVCAIVDDFLCLLDGVFAAQVGHALVCDENVDRVF